MKLIWFFRIFKGNIGIFCMGKPPGFAALPQKPLFCAFASNTPKRQNARKAGSGNVSGHTLRKVWRQLCQSFGTNAARNPGRANGPSALPILGIKSPLCKFSAIPVLLFPKMVKFSHRPSCGTGSAGSVLWQSFPLEGLRPSQWEHK